MIFADLDEARRYVEMKRAGAATSFDDTPSIDLIEGLVDHCAAELTGVYSSEEYDKAVEGAEEAASSRVREELLGDAESLAAEVGVPFLMAALESAIAREKREAADKREAEIREVQRRDEALSAARAATRKRARKAPGASRTDAPTVIGAGRGTP